MTAIRILALGAVAAIAGAEAAQAHITFANEPVAAESTVLAVLQVPHGCGLNATTEVRVKLPEGFVLAKPRPKPGWDLEVIKGDYAKGYEDHGKAVTSGAIEVRWSNGNLPDDFFDTFAIRGKVSGVAAGTSLAFPVSQICGADSEQWDEVAVEGVDPHSMKNPAPLLRVAASNMPEHGEHAGHMMGDMDSAVTGGASMVPVIVGKLTVSAGFVKAMLPGQPVGGGFVTVTNNGDVDDRLIATSSPLAGSVELHDMAMQGEVMRMRKVDGGIVIAAGKTVTLTPGGLHMMFMKLTKPFAQGEKIAASLVFEKAGKIDIVLPVRAAGPAVKPKK